MGLEKTQEPTINGRDFSIAIVAARFNAQYVDRLLDRVFDCLKKAHVDPSRIETYFVPGSLEIPYVANRLAQTKALDCIIALGVVFQGETIHDQIVCQTAAKMLQDIAINTHIPIIDGIIHVKDVNQAELRTCGNLDRGAEFANAALVMAEHKKNLN